MKTYEVAQVLYFEIQAESQEEAALACKEAMCNLLDCDCMVNSKLSDIQIDDNPNIINLSGRFCFCLEEDVACSKEGCPGFRA